MFYIDKLTIFFLMNHYVTSPINGDNGKRISYRLPRTFIFWLLTSDGKLLSHENGAKTDRAHICLNITGFVPNME